MKKIDTKHLLNVGIIVAIFVGTATNIAVLSNSMRQLHHAANGLRQSTLVREKIFAAISHTVLVENIQQRYIMTGDVGDAAEYQNVRHDAYDNISDIRTVIQAKTATSRQIDQVTSVLESRLAEIDKAMTLATAGKKAAAIDLIQKSTSRQFMEKRKALVAGVISAEQGLTTYLENEYASALKQATVSFIIFILEAIGVGLLLFVLPRRELRKQQRTSEQLATYARDLDQSMADLTRERNEVSRLNNASNYLQSCNSFAELTEVAAPLLGRLFEGSAGALHTFAPSRNQLDTLVTWGEVEFVPYLTPQQCWGLRLGQAHVHHENAPTPICRHLDACNGANETLCLPLIAHGETLGLLSLVYKNTQAVQASSPDLMRFAEMVSHQIGLTIANIRLRDSLNEQSIRDPLTGLFNRRYLDIVAEKEISKALRHSRPLGLVMFDIDHFKKFNDLHGHLAGDTALIAVAKFAQAYLRETDWVFRFGGEEFMVLMTETQAKDALTRIDQLREAISQLTLSHEGVGLPNVTISAGLAMLEDSPRTTQALIEAADAALYKAKQTGRNCVKLAA
ncbi:diguanylate cyclase [Asticcacaulis sp. 201]|uniref:sensor domain-containing diguanylate cyclase n=1 Tax=Asticcacaulis sp. 201 TaxID=3028787 RepID=UPI002916F8E5|nr:diguanylate cyclase [Asticcacaulis sp. 201]MDV6330356.1 diguanylate cyclase [Asticcacaulis sp. 201]